MEPASSSGSDKKEEVSMCDTPAPAASTEPSPAAAPTPVKTATFKLALVGDGGVGKSSFLLRHKNGQFELRYIGTHRDFVPAHIIATATLGCEVTSLTFHTSNGPVVLNVWDTAGVLACPFAAEACTGQDKFAGMREAYIKHSDCAIIMFDVTARVTYVSVPRWFNLVRELCPNIPIVLCGNKVDVRDRKVKPKDITWHRKHNLQYYDISGKSLYNFEKPFLYLIRSLTKDPNAVFVEAPVQPPSPLLLAVLSGDVEAVKKALSPSEVTSTATTPTTTTTVDVNELHPLPKQTLAGLPENYKRPVLVALVGECKADEKSKCAIAELLLAAGAEVQTKDSVGRAALHIATCSALLMKILLAASPPQLVNAFYGSTINQNEYSPLSVHAAAGNAENCQLLIEAKANIDTFAQGDNTALIIAVRNGHADVVRVLLSARANVGIVNAFGGSALNCFPDSLRAEDVARTEKCKELVRERMAQEPAVSGRAGQQAQAADPIAAQANSGFAGLGDLDGALQKVTV